MTTNALLGANVEIQGNLQVDGTFSAATILAATSATSMAINPGPLTVTGPGSASSLLQVTNTQTTPNAPTFQIASLTAGDRAFGIMVTGDGFNRFRADSNGRFDWGAGTAATDINLYRLSAGTLRTDSNFSVGGSILGGADTNANDFVADGVAGAGSVGRLSDSGHSHPEHAYISQYVAPTGANFETIPRRHVATNSSSTLSTSINYLTAIGLPANLAVLNLAFTIGSTSANGVTHGSYFLTDTNKVVRAVTSDVTNNTTWNNNNTTVQLSCATGYTTPSAGLYYLGISVTATTTPTLAVTANVSGGLASVTPLLYGTAGTSTTPPVIGSTLATMSATNGFNIYGYVA